MRFLIIIFDIFNYTERIADSYGIGRNIFHDNTSAADHNIVSDRNTQHNVYTGSFLIQNYPLHSHMKKIFFLI